MNANRDIQKATLELYKFFIAWWNIWKLQKIRRNNFNYSFGSQISNLFIPGIYNLK